MDKEKINPEQAANENNLDGQTQETAAELSPLELELADVKQKYDQTLRAYAEADNRAKRAEKDKSDAVKYAASRFARDLLDVADNLERALAGVDDKLRVDYKDFIEGLEITGKSLQQVFVRHDIQIIAPKDEKFDPNFHEAIAQVPVPNVEADKIIDVVQIGYRMGDRLLRPARVVVSTLAA